MLDLMNNFPEVGHIMCSFYTGQAVRSWHLLNWKALSEQSQQTDIESEDIPADLSLIQELYTV